MTKNKRYDHSDVNELVDIPQTKLPIFETDDIPHHHQNSSKRFRDKSAAHRNKKSKDSYSGKRRFDDDDYEYDD